MEEIGLSGVARLDDVCYQPLLVGTSPVRQPRLKEAIWHD